MGVVFPGLQENLDDVRQSFQEVRKQVIADVAPSLLDQVRKSYANSGIQENTGRVKGWQQANLGSLGGYVAIRPPGGSGSDGPGAITNYLEHGHKLRMPSGRAKRYVPSVKRYKAQAFGFYKNTQESGAKLAQACGEQVAKEMAVILEKALRV